MQKRIKITLWVMGIMIALSPVGFSQQSKSPVITTDDVLRVSRGQRRVVIPTPVPGAAADTTVQRQDTAEAERLWSERLRRAQERVRELRRLADATELEINRLKNFLFSAERRSSQEHKGVIAEIDERTAQMRQLRAEASAAQADVEALLSEGEARGFSISPTTSRGAITDRDEFRSRYGELNIDLLDAQRRIDVLQLRVNDIHRRITLNSGTGDEFYNSRLREQLRETEEELYDTRARIAGIRRNMEELRRQARAFGIYLN